MKGINELSRKYLEKQARKEKIRSFRDINVTKASDLPTGFMSGKIKNSKSEIKSKKGIKLSSNLVMKMERDLSTMKSGKMDVEDVIDKWIKDLESIKRGL